MSDAQPKKAWKIKIGEGMTFSIPGDVPRFSKSDIVRRVHGIEWGDPCFNCGTIWEEHHYPLNECSGCSALLPRLSDWDSKERDGSEAQGHLPPASS